MDKARSSEKATQGSAPHASGRTTKCVVDQGTFAQRMMALFQSRAQQQPLPCGFMHCPFDPNHHIPTAAIITHIEKVHDEDALALVPDAMYSDDTAARRTRFLRDELDATTSSSSSSSSSYSSSASRRRRRRRRMRNHKRCHRVDDLQPRKRARHSSPSSSSSSSSSRSSTPSSTRSSSSASTMSNSTATETSIHEEEDGSSSSGVTPPTPVGPLQRSHEASSTPSVPTTSAPTPALTMSTQIEQDWHDRCVVLRRSDISTITSPAQTFNVHPVEEEEQMKAVWRWLRAGDCAPVDMVAQGPCIVLVFDTNETASAARRRLAEDLSAGAPGVQIAVV